MAVKRKLRVELLADDFVVAESTDETLWRSILDAIYRAEDGGGSRPQPFAGAVPSDDESPRTEAGHGAGGAIGKFADEIGVSIEQLQGACRPTTSPPYIHLDHHNWEAMKRGTPLRGPRAISPIVLAATIRALWGRHAGLGGPTISEVQDVLDTIDVRDKNPSRGLRNCPWLQKSGSQVVINPAEISNAISIARNYVAKSWGGFGADE